MADQKNWRSKDTFLWPLFLWRGGAGDGHRVQKFAKGGVQHQGSGAAIGNYSYSSTVEEFREKETHYVKRK